MRIAFLTHQWPDARMGGIGTYVRQAALALAAAGHDVHVFTLTLSQQSRNNSPARVTLHETPNLAERVHLGTLPAPLAAAINAGGEGIYRLALGWLLNAVFQTAHRAKPFDVIEAPDVEALALPLLLNPARDIPAITHLHCCTAIAYQSNRTCLGAQQNLIQALEFAAIHLADGICAPTQAVVNATTPFTSLPSEPSIIPHPFDCTTSAFTPPPTNGPILFLGRVEWLKGCGTIVEALNIFLPRNPTARFTFIGPDTPTAPGGRSMQQYIQHELAPALASRVQFLGEVPHNQVIAELAGAAFCVQPSLRENFSMACCEAMETGRTVIVADQTGSPELLDDAGIVVPRDSAIALAAEMERLHRDQLLLDKLSQRAYDRIRSLCRPRTIATKRITFYKQTIARFQSESSSKRAERTHTLPPLTAAAILPALSLITGSLTGATESATTQSPGHRLNRIFQQLPKTSDKPVSVLLFGAGKHTARLLSERHTWEHKGFKIAGVIDDHPRFAADPSCLGLPVRPLAAIENSARAGETLPPIVLSTDTYEDQFWEQTANLRAMGVSVLRLYGDSSSELKKAV